MVCTHTTDVPAAGSAVADRNKVAAPGVGTEALETEDSCRPPVAFRV